MSTDAAEVLEVAALDVRAGMTSASNAGPDGLCPGRHFAQRSVSIRDAKPDKDSAAGTLIHRAFAGENVELDRSQKKTLNRGRYLEKEIVQRFFGFPLSDEEIMARAHREQRYWAHVRNVPIHSGQVDAAWITEDWSAALIEDLKGLFGDQEDATENAQLRDEAALFYENFGVKRVAVFINQPNVRWKLEEQKLVTYEEEDLKRAHAEMLARVRESNNVEAPRIPGQRQCRFCRAAGTAACPESQKAMLGLAKPSFEWLKATPAERGEFIDQLKQVESSVKKQLKYVKETLLQAPEEAEGWVIGQGDEVRSFKDPVAVLNVAMEYFGDKWTNELSTRLGNACLTISVPKLGDFFADSAGDEKGAVFQLLFGHLIERKRKEGSLERAKKK